MKETLKEMAKKMRARGEDPNEGEGFLDARGYNPEPPGVERNNGLNVNNDAANYGEREKAKKIRQRR